jgi:mRNA interferase MazF
MAVAGEIILFPFPQTNLKTGKSRSALVIKSLSNSYDDWLVCMISTKTNQEIIGFDEIISPFDSDFSQTGLKSESVIRVSRLAVISKKILLGKIDNI